MPGYRRLPSGKWQATVRLPDGRRRTRTDPLKGVVKAWAEDAEAEIRRGEWADPRDGRITLEQWWDEWSATRRIDYATTQRDASHWRAHVGPRWARVKLGAITAWDVEAWLADMATAGVGATTQAQTFRLLRQMLSDAARHRRIKSDPTSTVRAPKVPKHVDRFLTREEWARLSAAALTERDRTMMSLMTLAGLRWGEVAGLHAPMVDLARGQVTVVTVLRRNQTYKDRPKSAAGQRVVPLVAELAESLPAFMADGGPLFPGVDYTNWRRRNFVPAVVEAELADPQPTAHDLRHTFGSWLAEAGVPPHEIMKLMGHGTLRATERYLHASDGRFTRALAALGGPTSALAT